MRISLLNFVAAVALTLLTAHPVWAHKVNIFAYIDGNTVYTESYFPDGKPVREGTVEVMDEKDNKLLDGKTDDQGMFSFPLPKNEDLTIIINATMGHKNSYLLKMSDM